MEKKKYELTMEEIDMFISLASIQVLRKLGISMPKRSVISAGMSMRIQEHLEGIRPFSERDIEDYKLAGMLAKRFMEGFNGR